MKILAFDIATSTGLAFGGPGDVPLFKAVDLGQGRSDAARFAKAQRMVEGFVEARQPDMIALECPIGAKSSQVLVGLFASVIGTAHRLGVPYKRYQVASIRKHFIGKHLTTADFPGMKREHAKAEIKRIVIGRCKALGWPVTTDDEADACALWDYALAKEGAITKPAGGLFK